MPIKTPLFLLFLALLGGASALAEPMYRKTACPAPNSGEYWVECGVAILTENRKTSTGEVRIPIVRLGPVDGGVPAVVLGGGGPGGGLYLDDEASLSGWEDYRQETLGDDGILILMDQRGAGLSRPFLGCSDEYEALWADLYSFYGPMQEVPSMQEETELDISVIKDCLARLQEEGVQIDAYTTADAADDVEDIRQLLGIEQWHLIGISYGSRLALEVLRRHPQGVASAVLDAPFPYDAWKTAPAYPAASMLQRIDKQCWQQKDCRERHGSVVENITKVMAQAAEEPLTLNIWSEDEYGESQDQQVLLTPDWLISMFDSLSNNEFRVEGIPFISRKMADGYVDALNWLEPEGLGADDSDDSFADMLYTFIECQEGHFKGVVSQTQPTSELEQYEHANMQQLVRVCEALWGNSGNPPPVVSTDKPVLIISGVYDTRTPPSWGHTLARRLPNAQLVVTDGGHGHESFCVYDTLNAFFQSPRTPLKWQRCGDEKLSFE